MSASSSMPPAKNAARTGLESVNVVLSHANCVNDCWPSYQMQSAPWKHGAGVTVLTTAGVQPAVLNPGWNSQPMPGATFVASHDVFVLMVMVLACAVDATPMTRAAAIRSTFTPRVAFLMALVLSCGRRQA